VRPSGTLPVVAPAPPVTESLGAGARLAVGLLAMAATAVPLRRGHLGRHEVRTFEAVNALPDSLFAPIWVVMQLGALGAAPATAAVASSAGRRQLAVRLVTAGSAAWVLAKGVKMIARRGRPASFLTHVRHRGKEARGLGYLSGHAAVATALGAAAFPHVGRPAKAAILTLVPTVGMARIYVGAHLPLDVAGGAALGLAVDGALSLRAARRRARRA
jgi:membrane-associated phospholipid phosphatase